LGLYRRNLLLASKRRHPPVTPVYAFKFGRDTPQKGAFTAKGIKRGQFLDSEFQLELFQQAFPLPLDELTEALNEAIGAEEKHRARTLMKNHQIALE
jgi:hypothetical protein